LVKEHLAYSHDCWMPPNAAQPRYRIPSVLRDFVMVDMLELTGSTTGAAALMQTSQPSISRRYRQLADELQLRLDRSQQPGRRYANNTWIRLLRRGVNHHRLACGVLRIGGAAEFAPVFRDAHWAQWIGLGKHHLLHWHQLLTLELLDAVVLPEAPSLEPGAARQLALMELQRTVPLSALLVCRRDPLVLEIATRVCKEP
jgi:hypothetical protein